MKDHRMHWIQNNVYITQKLKNEFDVKSKGIIECSVYSIEDTEVERF